MYVHRAAFSSSALAPRPACCRARRTALRTCAAFTKVCTLDEVKANGNRKVVDVNGKKVLVAEADGQVYAVSNKCTHLNVSLVGKTPLLQGKVEGKCIVCPAHGTAFDLATGEVQGAWCPNFPELPFVGKGTKARPLPTYESRVDESGNIEVAA